MKFVDYMEQGQARRGLLVLEKTRRAVSEWSEDNFGENLTEYLTTYTRSESSDALVPIPHVQVGLDWLAPLLGIGEEIGELAAAVRNEDIVDACGDIGIYCLDFISRSNLAVRQIEVLIGSEDFIKEVHEPSIDYVPVINVVMRAYGALLHCHLKRFQNIRGMNDTAAFKYKRNHYLALLMCAMTVYTQQQTGMKWYEVVESTWLAIVAKRDWKKNQQTGTAETTS